MKKEKGEGDEGRAKIDRDENGREKRGMAKEDGTRR